MLYAEIAYASAPNHALLNRIHNGAPALQPPRPPTIRAVQQIKVYIPQRAPAQRVRDGRLRRLVGDVALQLRREEYVVPLHAGGLSDERPDGPAYVLFVVVPRGTVDGSVAGLSGVVGKIADQALREGTGCRPPPKRTSRRFRIPGRRPCRRRDGDTGY